jgi:branched-chain amino acid transport system permease protein
MIQQIINGVISGLLLSGIYMILTIGLALTFGVMRIISVCHSTFAILSAYIAYWLWILYGIDPIVSLLVSIPIFALIGFAIEKSIISPLIGRREHLTEFQITTSGLLALFGVMTILQGIMLIMWTGTPRAVLVSYVGSITVGVLKISIPRLIGFVGSIIVILLVISFLKLSYIGKAIIATAQNYEAAQLVGVNVKLTYTITFIIASATAAAAGAFLTLTYPFYPLSDLYWIVKMFCIIVLGGMGSLTGVIFGSLILGIAEGVAASLISSVWVDVVALLLLIFILLLRPKGLLGTMEF